MPDLYGQKITQFKRYAKTDRLGQARLPEWQYFALPYTYDTSVPANVDAYQNGLVVSQHAKFLADGVTANPKAGLIAPYKKDDALLGAPLGIILEAFDLTKELNVSVYLVGAWDHSVVAIKGLDVTVPSELAKLNGRNFSGQIFWNTTLPSI